MRTFSTKILTLKLGVCIICGYICTHVCMLKKYDTCGLKVGVHIICGCALYVGAHYTWVFTVLCMLMISPQLPQGKHKREIFNLKQCL